MKYFALLLMSVLIVGCTGTVEEGKTSEEEVTIEAEGEVKVMDEEVTDQEEMGMEEEEDEVAQVEEEDEDEGEADGSDDTETYVYESGTLSWTAGKIIPGGDHAGTVDIASATAVMDDESLVSAEFVINMTTIVSDSSGLDGHLKNDDFFSVEAYPTATLTLTEAKPDTAPDTYMMSGTLTIKDKTNPISFLATVKEVDEKISAKADFTIDRTKWGITYGSGSFFKDIGDKAIKDEIEFSVDVVLAEQ